MLRALLIVLLAGRQWLQRGACVVEFDVGTVVVQKLRDLTHSVRTFELNLEPQSLCWCIE